MSGQSPNFFCNARGGSWPISEATADDSGDRFLGRTCRDRHVVRGAVRDPTATLAARPRSGSPLAKKLLDEERAHAAVNAGDHNDAIFFHFTGLKDAATHPVPFRASAIPCGISGRVP
jgi:hypothetical protein